MTANGKTRSSKRGPNQRLVERWRAEVPRVTEIVEHIAPRLWDDAEAPLHERVPEEWRTVVESMREKVTSDAEHAKALKTHNESIEQLRGYHWSFEIRRVEDMIEYLFNEILIDIGFDDDDSTLASMLLVKKTFLPLLIELQDGGTEHGREDAEEYRFRALGALKCLSPQFDDVSLRRFRALRCAEYSSKWARPLMTEVALEEHLTRLREIDPVGASDRQRDWFTVTQPVLFGVDARASLTRVDERFSALDPLECYEEFAEASESGKGGKVDGGDGRTGAVRALARLAVRCGALDYEQGPDEDFDMAVERARGNLLVVVSNSRVLALTTFKAPVSLRRNHSSTVTQ